MENNKNEEQEEILFDTNEAAAYIYERLPEDLKEKIEEADVLEILLLENDYLVEIGAMDEEDLYTDLEEDQN